MPRQARLDMPGALHHIMIRGINKSDIFIDDEDREKFLERILCQNISIISALFHRQTNKIVIK
jgi:hypothetical protein